ncbi:calcium-binding protein [Shimia sp. SDUM112013]|uniref:calcium-binding protein n=1 Tax=Shimia sp. SDUM112013 TaxID=3136160 RepID=UPI0032EAFA92
MSTSSLGPGLVPAFVMVGTETLVNTQTALDQENSHVTWLQNGNILVTWESLEQDGSGDGIFAQMFDGTGAPIGGEFQVNTTTASTQLVPQVVPVQGGGFVVVWYGTGDIYRQLYDEDGTALGGELFVNTTLFGGQYDFVIDPLVDGGFVVSWRSAGQDGSFNGVYAQTFNNLGSDTYTEFQVNTTTLNNQTDPDFAGLVSGNMVAVWQSQTLSTSDRGIYMQMYSNTNTPIGGEQLVADSAAIAEQAPQVVGLTGGGFVVLYHDATNAEVWVKTYSETGAAIEDGHVRASNHMGSGTGYHGTLTALANDRFVVTWELAAGGSSGIGYRVFESDGSDVGGGLVHGTTAGRDQDAEVHALPDGGFVVGFTTPDASLSGVFVSRFSNDGVPLGDAAEIQCQVNTEDTNHQFDSSLSVNDDGDVVVTWTSIGQDRGATRTGVYMQILETPDFGTIDNDTMTGTAGNDTLSGRNGDDLLQGLEGDDSLVSGNGNDTLHGGDGDDVIFGGGGTGDIGDQITGGSGNDSANGGYGNDTLYGNAGNDTLEGSNGDDYLHGGGDADSLNGGDGSDTLIGSSGHDVLVGGDSSDDLRDVLYGGGGNDTLEGGYGNDELRGDTGNDQIAGGFGADTVIGGVGNDTLTGSAFGDQIFGGDGDDFVNGGFGHDRVNGGEGADRFFHIGALGHGSDWIQDYDASEGDVLVFGNTSATRNQFQINTTHTANAAGERSGNDNIEEAFVIYRPTGQIMWALVDGDGQSSINLQIGGAVFDLMA